MSVQQATTVVNQVYQKQLLLSRQLEQIIANNQTIKGLKILEKNVQICYYKSNNYSGGYSLHEYPISGETYETLMVLDDNFYISLTSGDIIQLNPFIRFNLYNQVISVGCDYRWFLHESGTVSNTTSKTRYNKVVFKRCFFRKPIINIKVQTQLSDITVDESTLTITGSCLNNIINLYKSELQAENIIDSSVKLTESKWEFSSANNCQITSNKSTFLGGQSPQNPQAFQGVFNFINSSFRGNLLLKNNIKLINSNIAFLIEQLSQSLRLEFINTNTKQLEIKSKYTFMNEFQIYANNQIYTEPITFYITDFYQYLNPIMLINNKNPTFTPDPEYVFL